jgi:hypothetical protein
MPPKNSPCYIPVEARVPESQEKGILRENANPVCRDDSSFWEPARPDSNNRQYAV